MICWELLFGFLRVSCFAFGGGYGAIPLIRDLVLSHGWLTDEALAYMIAVGESTPGPIMVNLATYVGSSQAGFWGAALATLAVILPSFLMILLIMAVLKTALKNRHVQAVLGGLKPCVAGVVLATGLYMAVSSCIPLTEGMLLDLRATLVTGLLLATMLGYRLFRKKPLSPILLILASACWGVIVYGAG